MRIEILVDNEDPQIFPLKKNTIVIGSSKTCDIFLQNIGISRRHLIITKEDEDYFVTDQGTTNGSYINEERLIPGRKIQFTSFFPVRLGHNVLVLLLSDEEADEVALRSTSRDKSIAQLDNSDADQATRTISLKELQSVKTDKLVQKRQEAMIQRNRPALPIKNKDKSRMFIVQILCVVILGGAIYFNIFVLEPEVTQIRRTETPAMKMGKTAVSDIPRFAVVATVDFTPKEKFQDLLNGFTCSSELEKYFCEKYPLREAKAIQTGTMLHLFLNGGDYYQQARQLIPVYVLLAGDPPSPEKELKYQADLKLTALLLLIKDTFANDLNLGLLKDVRLTLIVNFKTGEGVTENVPMVIVPESFEKLLKTMDPTHFERAKKFGADALYFMNDYFKIY